MVNKIEKIIEEVFRETLKQNFFKSERMTKLIDELQEFLKERGYWEILKEEVDRIRHILNELEGERSRIKQVLLVHELRFRIMNIQNSIYSLDVERDSEKGRQKERSHTKQ
ncbi:MAG: hypothetical protein J7L38_03960 [Thermoproteales archaeon]|nr:hypothetical protein [Thermoproteales archaeon]